MSIISTVWAQMPRTTKTWLDILNSVQDNALINLICFASALPEVVIRNWLSGMFLNSNYWIEIIRMFSNYARERSSERWYKKTQTSLHKKKTQHILLWNAWRINRYDSISQPFCAPTHFKDLHLRVFCKRTPPEWTRTSCFSQSWGSRRGVRLWNVPFSPSFSPQEQDSFHLLTWTWS